MHDADLRHAHFDGRCARATRSLARRHRFITLSPGSLPMRCRCDALRAMTHNRCVRASLFNVARRHRASARARSLAASHDMRACIVVKGDARCRASRRDRASSSRQRTQCFPARIPVWAGKPLFMRVSGRWVESLRAPCAGARRRLQRVARPHASGVKTGVSAGETRARQAAMKRCDDAARSVGTAHR